MTATRGAPLLDLLYMHVKKTQVTINKLTPELFHNRRAENVRKLHKTQDLAFDEMAI